MLSICFCPDVLSLFSILDIERIYRTASKNSILNTTYNMWVEYHKPNEKLVNPHIKTKAEKKIAFNPLFRGRLRLASG